jgi:DNA polymerase-3 subunit epsilon
MFFDTETTDWWKFDLPPTDTSQPHMMQVAAVLESDEGRVVSAVSALVSQRDWPGQTRVRVDPRVVELCGVTDDMVDRFGHHPQSVWNTLARMVSQSREIVAHNIEFDIGVLRRTAVALGTPMLELPLHRFCTMRESTDIVGIRRQSGQLKWPKLAEAYAHFAQRPMSGAHDALSDVYACRAVFRGISRHRSKAAS